MVDILRHIKSETKELHVLIETYVPVFSENFTLSDYKRLLEKFYGFYVSFETAVTRNPHGETLLPDWSDRRKTPWLAEDLLGLGHSPASLAELPSCSDLPRVNSNESLMGALYVTEGSTLGGQLISRHLQQSLSLIPGKGATFFAGHGENTREKWKEFTHALCNLATPENERQIVESAVETFKKMTMWLSIPTEQKR